MLDNEEIYVISENEHFFNLTGSMIKHVDGMPAFDLIERNNTYENSEAYGSGIIVVEDINTLILDDMKFIRNTASSSRENNPLIALIDGKTGIIL